MILKVAITTRMIVCVCAGVSTRQLEAVVRGGATTMKEVGRRCGAGAGCGSCKADIRAIVKRMRAEACAADVCVETTTEVVTVAVAVATA